MKKLIALLMTLVMLTGACAAFAEAEAVDHQTALMALLEEAGVELQPGDLSRPFQKALSNTVMQLVLTHTRLTEEQLAEWEAVKAAAHEQYEALETKDAEKSVEILNDAINGVESITPFTKSMLKRTIFNGMYLRSEITETEREVIRAIHRALEEALHGADEARTEEVLAGVREGMKEFVGLHNVRDDMMFILKFLEEATGADEQASAQVDQAHYEALLGMEDELLRALAIELLRVANHWQADALDGSMRAEINAMEVDWNNLSEENIAAVKDIVARKLDGTEIPEEFREEAIERMANDTIMFMAASDEEKATINVLLQLMYTVLENEVLDVAELAELEHELETLLYELAGDSEKYEVTPEDLAAVLENVDIEKVESLSDPAKLLLTIRFLEHFEVYSMLPEEATAKLPEIDQALFEAIQGIEVNGQETTMEQLQALEAAVVEVASQLDLPMEVMAKEVAKTVANCLHMSALSAEEQEIVEAAMEAISQTLAEGNRDEIRVLSNYRHQVQHRIEESLLAQQNAQA